MNPFVVLLVGVAISVLIIPLAWRYASSLGMIDEPDERKVHTAPVPRVGGWGIVFGTLIPIVLTLPLDRLTQSYVLGGLVLFAVGAWDDARELGHFIKFGSQILVAGIVVFYGDLWIVWAPYTGLHEVSPYFGKPFSFFAMVGVMNAINHSDGLDGLAGGESLLSLIVIAFLAYAVEGVQVPVVIACAAIGGVLGFLRYNTHPAQVFMGDSGSQFLGFTLAFLTIYLTQISHPALSPALPLLLIGLPIADILAVLYLRIKKKMNWFRATRNHIHHRLLDRGFNHYEAVVIIYAVQAVLVISAIFMRYQNDWLVTAWYLGVCGSVFTFLTVTERMKWFAHKSSVSENDEKSVLYVKVKHMLSVLPVQGLSILVPLFILAVALFVEQVPRDFGVISLMLFVLVILDFIFGKESSRVIMAASISAAAIFSTYLSVEFAPGRASYVESARISYFVILAIAIALAVRYSEGISFKTTPSDYLVVFGLVTVMILAGNSIIEPANVRMLIQGIVLLYACQVLMQKERKPVNWLSFGTLCALGVMGIRGVLGNVE